MKQINQLLMWLLLFSCSAWGNGQIVDITQNTTRISLLNSLEINRTPIDAQLPSVKQQTNWHLWDQSSPLQNNEALWGRSSFYFQGDSATRFTFVIDNVSLDYVDFYLLDPRGRILSSVMTGSNRPFSNRQFDFREFALSFELEPGDQIALYFRIQDDGPLVFSANLWKTTELITNEQRNLTFIGAFTGALLVLAAYFLVTYVLLHSPVRFWFAVSNLAFVLLFLNVEGSLGQLTGLTTYMSSTTTVLLALSIFCVGKVSHAMLSSVPVYWRYVTYGCSILLLVIATIFSAYWQILFSTAIGGTVVILHLILACFYYNPYNSLPNKIYAAGWISISSIVMLHTYLFLQGNTLTTTHSLLLHGLLLIGVLLVGVAVEAHENVLIRNKQEEQSNTIKNLNRFYDFFCNSAEGLFTANYEGELVSVNPAMCQLFGYEDERDMIANTQSIKLLFAERGDLDHLTQQLATENTAIGREIRGIKKDQSEFWVSMSVNMRNESGERLFFGSVVDITERKQTHISLAYLATHDPLTGVYNRRHFENELTDAMRKTCATGGEMTLLYLDLDQFKAVNDTCGHKAGDILLKELAQKLDSEVIGKGILGRMGGDEFAVLLVGNNAKQADLMAKELLHKIQMHRFVWENRLFSLGASVGLVTYHPNITSPEQMMSMADSACYVAKEQGRNQIHQYSSDDEHMQRYEMELNWLSHINEALETGNFVLYFQEYRSLKEVADGRHYELLVRMQEQDGNVTLPGSFLPAAERYKLISKIDRWVIDNYFSWLSQNPEHLQTLNRCNINLSGQSLANNDLQIFIKQAFVKYQIPYEKICFEITESMAIVKLDDTLKFMHNFHELGCKFALDDFGIGFSSYEYLKKLPVDLLKIDGSFVKNMLNDPIDKAMVRSMRDVAHAMGMETVAEYVENSEIMVELGKIGVDYAQGFGVAEPQPITHMQSIEEAK